VTLFSNLTKVRETIAVALDRAGLHHSVTIIAVTKTHPFETILEAHRAGLVHIGENRVQEAQRKFSAGSKPLGMTYHMIGHLQSNKVKTALDIFDTIDAIDSLKLAGKIGRHAQSRGKPVDVLLEVNTSGEVTKYGFSPEAIDEMLACLEIPGLSVKGLMTIGPFTEDKRRIREAFVQLRQLMDSLNNQRPDTAALLSELSMGMSGDYEIAVEEGSTMVRLGTMLFGPRRT
jgi:hypothetical protein